MRLCEPDEIDPLPVLSCVTGRWISKMSDSPDRSLAIEIPCAEVSLLRNEGEKAGEAIGELA